MNLEQDVIKGLIGVMCRGPHAVVYIVYLNLSNYNIQCF